MRDIYAITMKLTQFFILCLMSSAVAQLPTAPDNIICLPNTDGCDIQAFINYIGKPLTVEVERNNQVVGSTTGIVSGGIIAFQINHPNGICWGDGTKLKVTPKIQKGDIVSVKDGTEVLAQSTVLDGYITKTQIINNEVIVSGYIDATIPPNNIEVRIVSALLVNTAVRRRDVRALAGPFLNAVGYSSIVTVSGTTFTATFTFNDAATATIAGSSAIKSVSFWQFTDAAGNQQGITTSETGVIGGPFLPSCPPAAEFANNVPPSAIAVSNSILKWSPIVPIPGAPPVTAYTVDVMKTSMSMMPQTYGYIAPTTQNGVNFTITQIEVGDTIEVRTKQGRRLSDPIQFIYTGVSMVPSITSTPLINNTTVVMTSQIVLTSNTNQIVYTLDGTDVIINGELSNTSILYSGPIQITKRVILNAVSFDQTGLFSDIIRGAVSPVPQPVKPLPVQSVQVIVENGLVRVTWVSPIDPTIVGYKVRIYEGPTLFTLGSNLIGERQTSVNFMLIKDLIPGQFYKFAVLSINAEGVVSNPSPLSLSTMYPEPVDKITITAATWKITEFRVKGTGDNLNALVTVHYANLDNTIGGPIYMRGSTVPITGFITGCVNNVCNYDIIVKQTGPSTKPARIFVTSSFGGMYGPFNVQ